MASNTYYDYREVKVMIAHKLMKMEGWKVYGYKADHSDAMTDYWDPANWGGVAEKNGYVLCVNVYGASDPVEIKQYNYNAINYDQNTEKKIRKLEQMTTARGASEAEEKTAREAIKKLREKAAEEAGKADKYVVTGMIPGHMENPPKMNWHIEKDGVYVAKGNGLLKYADIYNYYTYAHCDKDMKKFRSMSREDYKKDLVNDYILHDYYYTKEAAEKAAENAIQNMEKKIRLADDFENFIKKLDSTCGGLIGEGEIYTYEKVKEIKYKKEIKAFETETGSLKEGQCFILKSNYTYGRRKGLIYRIHEKKYPDGTSSYYAYKMNGKNTKECTGSASQNNYWYIGSADGYSYEKLTQWIKDNSIAWCELREVKTPYEVEKVIKKKVKADKPAEKSGSNKEASEAPEEVPEAEEKTGYTYDIKEDTDTRDGSKIYLVKIKEKLSREEYKEANKYIKSLGGYYSKFKHGFLFREDPTEKLKKSA